MALNTGKRLGPYEILEPIGAGGMGEVYSARDTRLGREVAIKVLPESFARDPERLRRFEQEARTIAALNHPNILAVYDFGEHEGSPYIVCELLEGATLREKLSDGALSQRRAVEYASQIAEGLAAAHDKGVVHRDLKPENIFVTKDGRIELLDFGLAKLASPIASGSVDSMTAVAATHTAPGLVLGTAGYMSPEQVRGKEADARSDIFALGAIMYEMLSGRRAFRGESSVETMNAILKEDPPEFDTKTLAVSPGLERIVRRCLEKEPARRFHSARDVGFALEAISGSSAASAVRDKLPTEKSRTARYLLLALAVVAAIAAAYFAGRRNISSSSASYEQVTFDTGYAGPARFTRDGNIVVYSAAWNAGPKQLYAQRVNSTEAQPLNVDADVLGIADDGEMAVILKRRHLASWLQRGTLARMPLEGGAPRPMLEDVYDADITHDGKQFAVVRSERGKQRLEYPIGKVLFESGGWISDVRISPDAKQVAFIDHPIIPDDRGSIAVVDTNGVRRLTPEYGTGRSLCWTPDGKEIWFTASLQSEDPGVYAVTTAGKIRTVLRSPTELVIEDISATGKVLLESVRFQIEMGIKRGKTNSPSDVRMFGSDLGGITLDGNTVVFNRYGGPDYTAFVRPTNGSSPPLKVGEGYGAGITADGRFVAASLLAQSHRLYLYPTGAGDARVIDLGDLTPAFGTLENDLTFSADGKWGLFAAWDTNHEVRAYLLDMHTSKFRAVTPPGWQLAKLSLDGTRVVAQEIAAEKYKVLDIASGKITEPNGLEKQDAVLGWNTDGHSLIVWNQELPAHISQVDVASGKRQLIQTVEPLAMLGSMYARMVTSANGTVAAYRHRRGLYAIYIADGLR